MSLPTNFRIINRGEYLAVINFPRQKSLDESFEFMEYLQSLFEGELNKLPIKATEEDEINWLLSVLSLDQALTLSESSYDWLIENGYKPTLGRVASYDEAKEGVLQLIKGDKKGYIIQPAGSEANNYFYMEEDYSFKFGIGYGMYQRYGSLNEVISDFDEGTIEEFEEHKGYSIKEYPPIEPIDLSAMNMKEYQYVKEIVSFADISFEEVIKVGNAYYLFY